jgi:hypothetical protein
MWSRIWYGTCSRSIGDESAVIRSARGSAEEEKVGAGQVLQNFGSALASSALCKTASGLPLVKHAQQGSRGSGMENHQGLLDPDSHLGAEEFRASSSLRLA